MIFSASPFSLPPYEYPSRHWELDKNGQPTQQIIERRRSAEFITPIPKPRKQKRSKKQGEQLALVMDEGKGLSTADQQYDPTGTINLVREYIDKRRMIPDPNDWKVTPETARLLQHWRHYPFTNVRPFFCQVEAVETLIWLTEVAPKDGKREHELLERLSSSSNKANPGLERIALKMADDLKNTGKGNLFVIFGEPDIEKIDLPNGQIQIKINSVDVFDPSSGEVRSDSAAGIACWFIDTDYNEESFFVRVRCQN